MREGSNSRGPVIDIVIPLGDAHHHSVTGLLRTLGAGVGPQDTIVVVGAVAPTEVPEGVTFISTGDQVPPAKARNIGAWRGQAPWLCFLDADVDVATAFIGSARSVLAGQEDDVGAVSPDYNPSSALGAAGPAQRFQCLEERRLLWSYVSPDGKRIHTLRGSGMFIRRRCFEIIEGFDEQLAGAEDRDLCRRLENSGAFVTLEPSLTLTHSPAATLRDALRRKRWHAIGNAQYHRKHGSSGFYGMPAKMRKAFVQCWSDRRDPVAALAQLVTELYYLAWFKVELRSKRVRTFAEARRY
jgi:GT2 family glycosyltransferase